MSNYFATLFDVEGSWKATLEHDERRNILDAAKLWHNELGYTAIVCNREAGKVIDIIGEHPPYLWEILTETIYEMRREVG